MSAACGTRPVDSPPRGWLKPNTYSVLEHKSLASSCGLRMAMHVYCQVVLLQEDVLRLCSSHSLACDAILA